MVSHPTFEDQLACLSDQNMFASDIKDWSKDIGRCAYSVYVSYKTLHLVARRYYMVPTQGGVSFPWNVVYFTVCYYFQV